MMENLSYKTLEQIGYKGYVLKDAPEKVLQFGEGNFLRAFADYFFDIANERAGFNGKVVLVQPTPRHPETAEAMNAQDCLYTVVVRGNDAGTIHDDRRLVSSVSRCLHPYHENDLAELYKVAASDDLQIIVSNTTESGIVYDESCKLEDAPCASFPGKLTQVLYKRFQAGKPGVIVLSCELIDHNGEELLKVCQKHVADWGLGEDFAAYLQNDCSFCTTLVDSIVTGAVRDEAARAELEGELGYKDAFIDAREVFEMWGIQADTSLEDKLPFKAAGIDTVFVTDDISPYKKRKVRILNGAHTGFVPLSWLAGFDIVRDCMQDDVVSAFIDKLLYDEVIPTMTDELDEADLRAFAAATKNRFDNPYIDHQLLAIGLNSTSKWATRDLPTLLDVIAASGKVPDCLATGFAGLLAFYTTGYKGHENGSLQLQRADGTDYEARDDEWALEMYASHVGDDAALVHDVLACERAWGEDLTQAPGLEEAVAQKLAVIREKGAYEAMKACLA